MKEDEYCKMKLMYNIEGAVLYFYYEKFARKWSKPDEAKSYQVVKGEFTDRFKNFKNLKTKSEMWQMRRWEKKTWWSIFNQ